MFDIQTRIYLFLVRLFKVVVGQFYRFDEKEKKADGDDCTEHPFGKAVHFDLKVSRQIRLTGDDDA
jgi:hypothetical protein